MTKRSSIGTGRDTRRVRSWRERNERGAALVLTVMIAVVLAGLGVAAMTRATKEATLSGLEAERASSFEAAQGGVDDYIAKMTEDHQYYLHYVHPAESTRRRTNGALIANGGTWPSENVWTYPSGRDTWKTLTNGYEFNLQIIPPTNTAVATTIIASGRRTGSTRSLRTIEVQVRGTSVADFQMFAASDITVGSGATTNGRYYAGVDPTNVNVKHNVTHNGTYNADVLAEGQVLGTGTTGPLHPEALKIDSLTVSKPTLRQVIGPNPPLFNNFSTALSEVERASQGATGGGIYLNDTTGTVAGWAIRFKSTGYLDVYSCTKNAGKNLADGTTAQRPVCNTATPYKSNVAVPTIGAIYSQQTVMVSGAVKGRVTVVTQGDAILGDPIAAVTSNYGSLSYVTPGQDVLGIIANLDVIVPYWTASDTSVVGAYIALTGARHSWNSDGSHNSFTHTGATASNKSPFMDMFATRTYNYDANLQFLQPPFYPVLEKAYSILRFREITPP